MAGSSSDVVNVTTTKLDSVGPPFDLVDNLAIPPPLSDVPEFTLARFVTTMAFANGVYWQTAPAELPTHPATRHGLGAR